MSPDESQFKRKVKILQKAVTQEKSKRDKLKGDITKIKKKNVGTPFPVVLGLS